MTGHIPTGSENTRYKRLLSNNMTTKGIYSLSRLNTPSGPITALKDARAAKELCAPETHRSQAKYAVGSPKRLDESAQPGFRGSTEYVQVNKAPLHATTPARPGRVLTSWARTEYQGNAAEKRQRSGDTMAADTVRSSISRTKILAWSPLCERPYTFLGPCVSYYYLSR